MVPVKQVKQYIYFEFQDHSTQNDSAIKVYAYKYRNKKKRSDALGKFRFPVTVSTIPLFNHFVGSNFQFAKKSCIRKHKK